MGGAGFGQGFMQGMQQAQDRQMQMQQLKLQQDLAKFHQKHLETQDQMTQLQLQSLQRKMQQEMTQQQDREAFPGQLSQLTQPTLGANDFGPEPDIDRAKLTSLLVSAEQRGDDPMALLRLMAVGDPRIAAIHQSLIPEETVKLGEGEALVNKKTGASIAKGRAKAHTLSPGGSLVREGEETITAPPAPPKPPDYGDRLESLAAAYSQNKHGKAMTFSEMLAADPLEAKKLRDQAMVTEPATIAAGKLAATIPERKAELLTPSEANELGVPFGTTKGQAEGVMPITAVQRAALASYDSARVIIEDIRQYSEKVNTASGGFKGKAQQSMKLWGAWTQSDPDAAMLQSKAGELANLARSMGEKGALADKDVARAAALVPGVMDTREVAHQKLTDMSKLINEGEANFRKSLGVNARAPVAGKSSKAAPVKEPPVDPLAWITVPPGFTPEQAQKYKEAYAAQHEKVGQEMLKRQKPKPKATK